MKNDSSNSIGIDSSGEPGDEILYAGVVVSNVDGASNELRGFLGTIDWFGKVVVEDHVHRPGRLQSWLTHFAVVIEIKTSVQHDFWLLERTVEGVQFRKLRSDFIWHNFERVEGGILCSIPEWDTNFNVTTGLIREDILRFLSEQKRYPYNIKDKNCQHFAYEFFRVCLRNDWIQHGSIDFESFSEMLQKAWVDSQRWQ